MRVGHYVDPQKEFKENSIEVWPLDAYLERKRREVTDSINWNDWDAMKECVKWAEEHCETGTWLWDGITIFSYKFFFKDPEDALAFKLKFGI